MVNGSGKTKTYNICNRKAIYRRKEHNSYWFRYEELFKIYNEIPKKLDIDEMISNYIKQRKENYTTPTKSKKYTIQQYDINTNKLIKKYKNRYDASKELKVHKEYHINILQW